MNVPMYGNAYCPLFKMYNFVKFNEWKQKLNEWKLILKIWKNVFFFKQNYQYSRYFFE